MTMLEKMAAKVEEALEDPDLELCYASWGADVCVKDAKGIVRLVLEAMREPSEEVCSSAQGAYDLVMLNPKHVLLDIIDAILDGK